MAIITLTSDWGLSDHYISAVKGAIICRMPDANIIDITHSISKFSLGETAFIIKNAYKNFPKGSIHIIGVNSESSIEKPHTVIFYDEHYFIGSDNGLFSLLCDHEPEKIFEITVMQDSDYFTFPSRDIFAKVACMIAEGTPLDKIGVPRKELTKMNSYLPVSDKNSIKGIIVYFDSYDNAFTNITEALFREVGKGRKFSAYFKSEEIQVLHKSYSDVPHGDIVLLFSTTSHLEIAINKGSAKNLLGINIYDSFRIEFK
jgi:S-adenosyl-L-methionine hydrolase (adenosine-forming)